MSDSEISETEGGDLVPTVIDFIKMNDADGEIREGYLLAFGLALRWMMPALFKGGAMPISIRGTKPQLRDFANVMSKEKRYLQSWKSNGLDSPHTYKNKAKLGSAISQFERTTGVKWPFKQ